MNQVEKFNKISEKLFPRLKYLNKPNKQLIITFAGIPGSGKTYIAKILEEKYKGIRITNDEIMNIIDKNKIVETIGENEELKKEYIYSLIKKWDFNNKFIIIDAGFERKYEKLLHLFNSENLSYFIINLKISKEDAIKRVKEREPRENWQSWIDRFERWVTEYKNCLKDIKPDITLDGMNPDFDGLYEKLDGLPR